MYQQYYKKDVAILSIIIILIAIFCYWASHSTETIYLYAKNKPVNTPIPTEAPLVDNPYNYIVKVFGVYAPRAFDLLTNPACHENLNLNPLAVFKDSDGSEDRGIFQINNIRHPFVSDSCAFDYKCNTDYAWRMFKNDNYTFKRWSCGQKLGI
jgi:hypothetical protein